MTQLSVPPVGPWLVTPRAGRRIPRELRRSSPADSRRIRGGTGKTRYCWVDCRMRCTEPRLTRHPADGRHEIAYELAISVLRLKGYPPPRARSHGCLLRFLICFEVSKLFVTVSGDSLRPANMWEWVNTTADENVCMATPVRLPSSCLAYGWCVQNVVPQGAKGRTNFQK